MIWFIKLERSQNNTYDRLKQYSKAIADSSKVIELDLNNAKAYYNRGTTYSRLKEYNKAIADLSKLINLNLKVLKDI